MTSNASPTGTDVVLYERRGHTAIVTLNRPDVLNALNTEVQEGLRRAWRAVEDDDEVRVAILTGAGRAFSAGADLKTMEGHPPEQHPRLRSAAGPLPSVAEVTKPVIAAVNGYCLAGALELATACDMRIASEHAQFGSPEVKWNVLHSYGALRLPHAIPMAVAMEMMLTGEFIDAQRALSVGLVSRVVPHEELMPTCEALAEKIAANGQLAVRITKRLAYASLRMGLDQAREVSAALSQINGFSPDSQEGPRAFAEKRPPEFPTNREA
ncbi:MAG: enoyl-CoA hydratase/isomerase family protein [Chloroflexi bacterium]|nr:enoyl-CoA hydratase/isomerase family protein [Chloroflexota bacterium]